MKRSFVFWLCGVFLVSGILAGADLASAKDGDYQVVSPMGNSTMKVVSPAPRLTSLQGKKIGLIWNVFTNGDVLANALGDLLSKRFRSETVRLPSGKGLNWGSYPEPSIKEVVKEAKIDALIAAVGG
jgi:hypothetical protein